jgi:tetratricopeptide (TPR) repeat protein
VEDTKDYLEKIDRLYETLQDDAAVEAAIKQMIEDYAAEKGTADAVYATLNNELGSFYRHRERYPEGEAAFLQAVETLTALGDIAETELAVTRNNLAELYRLQGKLDQAEEQLTASLEVFIAAGNDQVVPYAAALNYLGHVKLDRGLFDEAVDNYERSRDLLIRTDGPTFMLITAYANLVSAFIKEGRLRKAVSTVDEAQQQLGDAGNDNDQFKMLITLRGVLEDQANQLGLPDEEEGICMK